MKPFGKYLFYLLPPVLAFIAVLTVDFKTDLSAFIIAGNNNEEIILASEMQSGALSRRYLISISSKNQSDVPAGLVRSIQERLKKIPGVTGSWRPKQQDETLQTLQNLYSHHATSLYSRNPENDLKEIFSPLGLQRKAEFLKNALLSPQSAMIKRMAVHDPLLLTLNGFQSVAEQYRKQADTNRKYQNLILETAMSGLNAVEQGRIQQAIHQQFKHINQSWKNQYQLEMTGVPVFAVATQTLIQADVTQISILSSVALMILFLLIFRSFSAFFQVFTLLAIVIVTAILITQYFFGYVHGMTVAIGSTLVGICIDYPIHAVVHAQASQPEQRTAVIARIWPSMLLGGVTTMVGYLALGFSGYPGFQQVAVYAGSGIIIALLLTRFILPDLINSDKPTGRILEIPLASGWITFCQQHRRGLIAILVLTLATSLYGLKSLQWLQDMQQLTPELDYLKQNDRRIRSRMLSIEPGRFILVTANTIEQALQKTEQVYQVLDRLKMRAALSEYFGLYPWLLSARQQRDNQQALKPYLTGQNLLLWRQALQQQGLSIKRLGHFDYSFKQPLTLEQVFDTPVKRLLDSRIFSTDTQTIIMIWIAEHQPATLQAAFADTGQVRYFSQRDLLNTMLADYTQKAKILLSSGLALIVLLLIIRYKSLWKACQTLFPALLAACYILGIWSITATAISFLHLVGFLLAVAICVDYGIFYQENRGGNLHLTYQAMAASMLTSALAFACLAVAESSMLRILAGVVTLGVVLGFLICPIIINHPRKTQDHW